MRWGCVPPRLYFLHTLTHSLCVHAHGLQTEQDFSRNNSTFLNVAYRTLKDPTLRAKYLVGASALGCLCVWVNPHVRMTDD